MRRPGFLKGFGDFAGACHKNTQGNCNAHKSKAKQAVDDLKSFYERRGKDYLSQNASEFFKKEYSTLEASLNKVNCVYDCHTWSGDLDAVIKGATARLAEMQADVDLLILKKEEAKLMQAVKAKEEAAVTTTSELDLNVVGPGLDVMALFQQYKTPALIAGGVTLAAVLFFVIS